MPRAGGQVLGLHRGAGARGKKLIELPTYPKAGPERPATFRPRTEWERLVADYAGVGLPDVGGLPALLYLALRRDAYVHALSRTEDGRRYLEDAFRLTQTGFDAGGMRRAFGASRKQT